MSVMKDNHLYGNREEASDASEMSKSEAPCNQIITSKSHFSHLHRQGHRQRTLYFILSATKKRHTDRRVGVETG